jgi:uncharacterized membrane protein
MASDDDLRQQLAELSARVASLEATLQALLASRPDRATAVSVPAGEGPSGRRQGREPAYSLENRIGAQLLNRIGIVAVLIGMAWFLKLAFDRNWIGPGIRVLIGLACATGLMVWSERFRRQGFPAFSYSLKALGTSIAYLALWAASSVFHLAPSWLVFLAMTGVTIANAVLARRQSSELLAIYALAGGLSTPGLLTMGQDSPFFLFSYLALLNGGALLLLARHPWKRLAWAALLGTAVYYVGWTLNGEDPTRLQTTAYFLGLFFAGFAAAPFLILRRRVNLPGDLFPIVFPIANAIATWVGWMVLFGAMDQQPVRPWVTIALALACLLLAALSRPAAGVALSRTYLGLGVLFITVAAPLQFHGPVVTLCWLGESLALVALAKAGADAALRVFAAVVLSVASLALLLAWIAGTPHPLAVAANMQFVTNLVGVAVFAAVLGLSLRAPPSPRVFGSWMYLAGFASVAFSLTVLVAVCLEIHHYWFCGAGFFRDFCGGYGQFERRSITAQLSYSACCMLYGAALMTVGFLRRNAFLRWQALALFAFSIGLVFLNGVSRQGQGYRVLSFLALGVVLITVSFAYQRDWLRLRG